ncbi:MAG TPA: KEOPS complex subunit Pcc1 [Nitrososphaeraceae archaeon]|nr:KEOPS complex subunit Pcc1 [Nitrososphaeraceae archaeon]
MSKPKSCTAKIQISFWKKETKLKRKGIVQSISIALQPPMTFSPSASAHLSSPTSRANPSNLDINTKVSCDDNSNVFIEIESDDIPSLRAGINSYLRLADASYRCIAEGNLES